MKLLTILLFFLSQQAFCQTGTAKYQEIPQDVANDSLNGVYIPKDLQNCFVELDKHLSISDKQNIRQLPGNKDAVEGRRDLGKWIRGNWGLWTGSRLQQYFRDKKINHPDRMSAIILKFYYDWLKGNNGDWEQWVNNFPRQTL